MADLFTRFVDGTSKFRASHMNAPLIELETEINADKTDVAALALRIEALEAQVFRMSPSASSSESPSVSSSSSESPSVSPSPSPS